MKTRKKRGIRTFFMIILALIIILALCNYDSNHRLTTSTFDVYSSRLPDAFDGFRVVQLSDLHGASFGTDNEKLLDAVRNAEPDIIAVTGDMFDEYSDDSYAPEMTAELVKIAPVYYVSGNHEWVDNPRPVFAEMRDAGAVVLRNEYVTLERGGETIVLAGVDDPNGPYDMISKEDFVAEIKAETDDYILMLSHRNTDFDLWTSLDVDLVLCGHAHGGIIRLPIIGGVIRHPEDTKSPHLEGVFAEGGTTMIVSRGIGNNSPIPMRMFNNPEIVVAVLHTGEG
jgi:predicted MPP superfamily phosphohydrolase